jgi:hypothetical protein
MVPVISLPVCIQGSAYRASLLSFNGEVDLLTEIKQ